ncbi:DUF4085 family protein [Solibacillus silvestris]|uniref:DUF4085 family protein n=1 Tax=Solibacillus silvestris TaxID=76853 RepID=UPI003F81E616
MFFLTRELQEEFNAASIYPFEEEEVDAEFKEILYEQLAEYIDIVPHTFRQEIIERILFQNNALMAEFEKWSNGIIAHFTTNGNAVYEMREAIVECFHPSAQHVFQQSLHDGKILNAEQQGNEFTLLLDMSGGFTVESIVQLVFHSAQTEGELEGYYIYDELVKNEEGFALRVLSSFGSRFAEWTIFFKDVMANCLYRPSVYIERGTIATWSEYAAALNKDDKYYIVNNSRFMGIDLASLSQTDRGIFADGVLLGDTYEEARERIYCATYEDPYAHLSEPIPADELLFAMFDSDQNMRVRAFNTIFARGEEVAYIANAALRKADVNEEENMYFCIIANHFNQLGCLEYDMKLKWLSD